LEEVKKAAETLVESRGAALVVATKGLVTSAQGFTVIVNQSLNDKTPKANKVKVEDYTNKVKATLKNVIPAAKAVGILNNNAENTPDLKNLKREVQSLVDSCEIMLISLRMDGSSCPTFFCLMSSSTYHPFSSTPQRMTLFWRALTSQRSLLSLPPAILTSIRWCLVLTCLALPPSWLK